MRRRWKRIEEIDEPSVNLTPLIDIVFTILIMFIVIAPLLELDRVELADAGGQGGISTKETSPIAIHVHKDNSIWLNQDKVQLENLSRLLTQKKGQFPQARPQLYHDKYAYFGTFQSVKNAVESAGFEEIDVILKPDGR